MGSEHTIKAPTCYSRPHDAGRFRPRVAHAAPERRATTVPVGYGRLRPLVKSAPLTPCHQVPQGVYQVRRGRQRAQVCGRVAVWLCGVAVAVSVCMCLCAGQAYVAPGSRHALSMPVRTPGSATRTGTHLRGGGVGLGGRKLQRGAFLVEVLVAFVASVHRRYRRPRGWWAIGQVVGATTGCEAVHVG